MNLDKYLTPEQQTALKEQRLQQFAAEAFQHQINRQIAERIGDTEAITTADQALATLAIAIEEYENA